MPAHQTPAQCTDFIGDCPRQPKIVTNVIHLSARESTAFILWKNFCSCTVVYLQLCWFWLFPVGYSVVPPVTGVPVARCPTLQTTILNMLCCCPFMIRVHMPTWESYQRLFSNSSDDFYFKREQMTNILRIFLIVERNLHCFLHFDLKTLTSLSLLLLRISRLSRYIK